MSAVYADTLKGLTTFLQDHQTTFVNGILVALTLGGEQVFRVVAFNCPCAQPTAFVYGCSFLAGPALVLLALGILVNNLTWRLCQGCVHRSSRTSHGGHESFRQCVAIFTKACIAPSAWLFIALLDGNYYVCLMSSSPCEADSGSNRSLIATSQIISWMFLVAVVLVSSIVMIVTRCTDQLTFSHNWYMTIYRDAERQRMEEVMKEKAQILANANIDAFFNKPVREVEDWEAISLAPMRKVIFTKHCKKGEPYYTPLHRWAEGQCDYTTSTAEDKTGEENVALEVKGSIPQ